LEPEITFDLGSEVSVESVKVWNYNEDLPDRPELLERGVAVADILVAGEDLEFSVVIEEQEFDIAPGDDTVDFGQVIELGVQARYVKFDIDSNHGGDADFVGLSEVIFFGSDSAMPGDFDGNGVLNAADIDALTAEVIAMTNDPAFDLNQDGRVDQADRQMWVVDLRKTWFGDSNLEGEFNSSDLVQVFSRGEYEDTIAGNSTWADGDWNGDADFNSSDLVTAFSDGGFELGPRPEAMAVPEPSAAVLLVSFGLWLVRSRRRVSRA
jgi:hypothetical protein